MYISYQELLNLRIMRQAHVVGGERGLYRLISWFSIVERIDYKSAQYDHRLVFIAGIGMKDFEKELSLMVEYIAQKNPSGIVIEIGPYIKNVPRPVVSIANDANIPIIVIPFDIRVSQITHDISQQIVIRSREYSEMSGILHNIIEARKCENEQLEALTYYGYRNDYLYCVGAVRDEINHESKLDNSNLHNKLTIVIMEELRRNKVDGVLWMRENSTDVFLLPLINKSESCCIDKEYLPNPVVYGYSAGIGSPFTQLGDAWRSLAEAYDSLDMIRKCKKSNEIRNFENMGIYRLLSRFGNMNELGDIYRKYLGSLVDYDNNNKGEYLFTLEVFLDNKCSITDTAHVLNMHRNTVKYRVNRIQEILHCDYKNTNDLFNLRLALKIKKYLK